MKKVLLVVLCIIFPPLAILWLIHAALDPIFRTNNKRPEPARLPLVPVHPKVQQLNLEIDLAECRLNLQKVLLEQDVLMQNRRFVKLLEPDRLRLEQARLHPPPPRIIREQVREIEVRQIVAPPEWQLPQQAPRKISRKTSEPKVQEAPRRPRPPQWVLEFERQLKEDEVSMEHLDHLRSQNPDMHPSLRAKLDLAEQKIREALDIKITDARMQILKRKVD